MPTPDVLANAGGMPRFDRAAIMKAAWSECRRPRTFNGKFCFGRSGREAFANLLKKAWHDTKGTAGTLSTDETARDRHVEAIRSEIDALKYKPLQMNIYPPEGARTGTLYARRVGRPSNIISASPYT